MVVSLAILMCGGRGKRLGVGEKPLFRVCGQRLVDHALNELDNWDVIAVTSPYVPETEAYLRNAGVEVYRADGKGYVADYMAACRDYSVCEPVLIVSSDIVYLRRGLIEDVVSRYASSDRMALRVVAAGKPAGIGIIDTFFIEYEQEEEVYEIGQDDIVNINSPEDVERAEALWMLRRIEGEDLRRD